MAAYRFKPLQLNRSARRYLVASYLLLIASFGFRQLAVLTEESPQALTHQALSLLSIPAYGCALISVALFAFGEQARRIAITVGWTLTSFLVLSLLMEPLDWPLRHLAGDWSGWLLSLIGQSVELSLTQNEEGIPMLILMVNEHPFHVASECNGFGVILTSVLVSILLAFYRRLSPFDFGLNLLAGLLIGFAFNTLRIVIIVLLAPHMLEHYMLMHEIVGGVAFWGCLVATWLILNGPTRDEATTK